jgi:hypothetical protein
MGDSNRADVYMNSQNGLMH